MALPVITIARDLEASLESLDEAALRGFLRDLVPGANHREALVEAAAQHNRGAPYLDPDPKLVEEATRVARSIKRKGDLKKPEMQRILARARRLLLRGDVADARKVYEIVLGLAADLAGSDREPEAQVGALDRKSAGFAHAGSYLVSVYETAVPEARVEAMLDAVERLSAVDVIASPIELMSASAVRPLEDLRAFTREWAALLDAIAEGAAPGPAAWTPSHAMLAEALEHIDGLDGLARAARRSGDLVQFKTWVMRVVAEGRFDDAIDIASEAGDSLTDAFGRGLMFDAAVTLAEKASRADLALPLLERAFLADPSTSRLARWLLWGNPSPDAIEARALRAHENAVHLTPRMAALLFALEGSIEGLVSLLEAADDGWGGDENPGPLAFPAVLLMMYGGPKATPIAARVCAPLFTAPNKGEPSWRGWSSPNSLFGEPSTPDPGPYIAAFSTVRATESLRAAPAAAAALRQAAAIRTNGVLANRERGVFEATAALVVAAAESTLHVDESEIARAYLGEVAVAAAAHAAFRSALTKTLAKSALVNAL